MILANEQGSYQWIINDEEPLKSRMLMVFDCTSVPHLTCSGEGLVWKGDASTVVPSKMWVLRTEARRLKVLHCIDGPHHTSSTCADIQIPPKPGSEGGAMFCIRWHKKERNSPHSSWHSSAQQQNSPYPIITEEQHFKTGNKEKFVMKPSIWGSATAERQTFQAISADGDRVKISTW